ncbi:MAG: VCBS repeat-containing protein [Planctomycetes bacterium]|nr:VCBS repeat-containing protein [Planctomycetota bacterium]
MFGVLRGAAAQAAFLFHAVLLHAGLPDAATGQAPQPFLPATSTPHTSLSTQLAVLDINRDGSDDLIAPGLFFGSVLATLDEHGATLATNSLNVGIAPSPRSTGLPTPVAMRGGDLDLDGRDDLVFVQSDGSVFVQYNLGSRRIDEADFGQPQLIDFFGPLLTLNPPFAIATFPKVEIADLNGDGLPDIAVGCGVHDSWNGIAAPGLVACYLANAAGGYTITRLPLIGSVVDLEWADVDGDGQRDRLVMIFEHGGVGAFVHELVHLRIQNATLVQVGPSVLLGPGRPTSLELGDVDLDGWPDYVVSVLHTGGSAVDSEVVCLPGDGAGNPNLAATVTLPLPSATGVGSFVPSVQVADFNGDGVLDVAALRGTVTTYPTAATVAQIGESEVLVCMGPLPFTNAASALPLGGQTWFSHCAKPTCNLLPLRAEPDQLKVLDLGSDGMQDLMIAGARPLSSPTSLHRVTLRNGTPPSVGTPAFVKVGEPSGGDPQLPARIGFDGGEPRLGNHTFACTLQNLRPGCLCGLMWGTYAQNQIANVYGFDLHIGPQEFGYPVLSSGPATFGFASYSLPIPNTTALVGDAGYFQFNYYDPAVGAFGATQATGVWIAP